MKFNGWGGFTFVGLGAAVLGFSPTYQKLFITDEVKDYWIMVRACRRLTGGRADRQQRPLCVYVCVAVWG